jgi:hypothetical protein
MNPFSASADKSGVPIAIHNLTKVFGEDGDTPFRALKKINVDITAGETVDSLKIEDITEGSGDPITAGKSVAFNYIIYRTDTAEQLESTWQTGQPQNLPFPGDLPEVLQQGFDGLQVGTLRKLSIPYAEAKNVFQLDGETDIILVIDVVAIY